MTVGSSDATGRFATDRWSIDLPPGWTVGTSTEGIELVAPTGTALILISDLQLDLPNPTPDVALSSLRSALDSARVAADRTEEEPFTTEDGRHVALGSGAFTLGHCAAAAHAWPGSIVLLTLFQRDPDEEVRDQARSIFLSVRRVDPAAQPQRSRISRWFGG